MSEVKRWAAKTANDLGRVVFLPSPNGHYVKYEDYAALQQNMEAMLAENVELKERERRLLKNIHEDLRDTDFHLAALQTPATDAIANELRAEGAVACGVHLREWYDHQVESRAEEFAETLRAGNVEGGE